MVTIEARTPPIYSGLLARIYGNQKVPLGDFNSFSKEQWNSVVYGAVPLHFTRGTF